MTFAASVKNELSVVNAPQACCLHAEAYGLLLFAKAFTPESITFQTEHEWVARRCQNLIQKACGVPTHMTAPARRGGLHTVFVPAEHDRMRTLDKFGHTGSELVLRLNRSNIELECCEYAFFRGAFLSCGTISNPRSDYHLEFLISHRKLAQDLADFIGEKDLKVKVTPRKGAMVVYIKESESIEDFLTMTGAVKSTLEIMNVKIYKDIRNRVNRITNCETANISKTVEAVLRQLHAIDVLEKAGVLNSLPGELQEMAQLRRENTELSLSELGELLQRPLSRSGVNHRLQRLIREAQRLENG